jgi:hypothetical protein
MIDVFIHDILCSIIDSRHFVFFLFLTFHGNLMNNISASFSALVFFFSLSDESSIPHYVWMCGSWTSNLELMSCPKSRRYKIYGFIFEHNRAHGASHILCWKSTYCTFFTFLLQFHIIWSQGPKRPPACTGTRFICGMWDVGYPSTVALLSSR